MKEPEPADPHTRIREIFEEASDLQPDKRAKFLDLACGDDADLRANLEELLGEAEADDSPLEQFAREMVWPALESLGSQPDQLQAWLDDLNEDESPLTDSLVGKNVAHFKIEKAIGRGGMGMVYKAHDTKLDRIVALKFLPPALNSELAARERFVHEAKAASSLEHAHVAAVHEIGETADQQVFIAMGYYPGETLKAKIDRGCLEPKQALKYAIQLAGALAKVHQLGIIHRDIKPGNIQITEDDEVKLLDFGLAKLSYASGFTQVGSMIGTVAYMSPEQANGKTVDHRTDLWSLGVILYEMLTGRRPFDGEDAQSAIHAIIFADPEPPSAFVEGIPKTFERILGRCLMKDPGHRYSNSLELLQDLERAREGLDPKMGRQATAWKRRCRWPLAAGGGAVVGAAVLAALLFSHGNSRDQIHFTRITEGPLVEDTGYFCGIAWGDYDGDGNIDVAVANDDHTQAKPIHLYHNNGDGTFTRVTEGILATDPISAFCLAWTDQDNDGDLDLFVATFQGSAVDAFFRNEGNGVFSKVTEGAWVNTPGTSSSAIWGDYDNDGFVDLYVANLGTLEPEKNFLYRNLGDGTMAVIENVTTSIVDSSTGSLWTDYDKDGDIDLLVGGRISGQYRNDGAGQFTRITPAEGGIPWTVEGIGIYSAFASGNYDNDRDLDLFVTTWETEPNNRLFYNEFGGRFFDASYKLPSDGLIHGMGASWGDYDNDGYLDLYVSNNGGPNLLYHNEGDGNFLRVKDGPLVNRPNPSCGGTWIDYDNDGDLDLMVSNGVWAEFEYTCELYRNEGNSNHWISLTLIGTISNRSAMGAKVWVSARISGEYLSQLREICGGGHGNNQPDPRAHFGLGDATTIGLIRIEWPSGIVQELHDVAADQFLTITEESTDPAATDSL